MDLKKDDLGKHRVTYDSHTMGNREKNGLIIKNSFPSQEDEGSLFQTETLSDTRIKYKISQTHKGQKSTLAKHKKKNELARDTKHCKKSSGNIDRVVGS